MMTLVISACHPIQNDAQQHQSHFICQALIHGYLKAQHLGEYEVHQQTNQLNRINYVYQKPTTSGLVLGIPPLQQIKFECHQSSQHQYQVFLIEPSLAKTAVLYFNATNNIK